MQLSQDIPSLLDGRSSSSTTSMHVSTHRHSDQLASTNSGRKSKKEPDTRKVQCSEDDIDAQNCDSQELSTGLPSLPSPTSKTESSRTRTAKKLLSYNPYYRREQRKRELDELQPLLLLETEMDDGSPCSICEKRGTSQPCSQVGSSTASPKFSVKHYLDAAFFAAQVAKPDWMPSISRLVMYTDGSASRTLENNSLVVGAGITYKWISRDNSTEWTDSSYGIVGTNCANLAELYAVGLALKIAVHELETTNKFAFESERQDNTSSLRVVLMTDSQNALNLVHDYNWRGEIPGIISRDAFLRLMRPIVRLKQLSIPIEFHWVPGHMDIEGNDRADSLAGAATRCTRSRLPGLVEEMGSECDVIQIADPEEQASINNFSPQRPKRKSDLDEIIDRPPKRASNLGVFDPEVSKWKSTSEEEVRSDKFVKHKTRAVVAEQIQELQSQWTRSSGPTLHEL